MKKIVSLLVVVAITAASFCVYAAGNNMAKLSVEKAETYNFSADVETLIKNKLENGDEIYFGEGTTTPEYLKQTGSMRSIPTEIITLPDDGGVFSFKMQYGNVYYSPFLFKAISSCSMKIHRAYNSDYGPCNINLQLVDKTTDTVIFDNDVYVGTGGATSTIPLTNSHQYYIIVTPLDAGRTGVNFYVYGQ